MGPHNSYHVMTLSSHTRPDTAVSSFTTETCDVQRNIQRVRKGFHAASLPRGRFCACSISAQSTDSSRGQHVSPLHSRVRHKRSYDGYVELRRPDGPPGVLRVLPSCVRMLAIGAFHSLCGPLPSLSKAYATLEVLVVPIQGGQQAHRSAAYELGELHGCLRTSMC